MIFAESITRQQFDEIQGRYTNLVKSISKPGKENPCSHRPLCLELICFILAKKDEDTLEQLDKFRYHEAPEKYCRPEKKGKREIIPLAANDLRRMVSWKLYVLISLKLFSFKYLRRGLQLALTSSFWGFTNFYVTVRHANLKSLGNMANFVLNWWS